MRISKVSIKNFRSLKDVEIGFEAVTTFIGPNGVGKSTVLRALDWFFNGSKGSELGEADCSNGDVHEPIEVRVTFNELSDADRQALGKYVTPGSDTFTAWKIRDTAGAETLSANAKGFPAFSKIKTASTAAEKKLSYIELREADPELGLPVAATGPRIDEALTTWEAQNLERLENVPEVQTNFFGFNGNGKMSGLFDFVLVTADLRATEESEDSKASIIGRILERTVDRSAADSEIAAIVEDSQKKQQAVYGERFSDQLEGVQRSLNSLIGAYVPGRMISVKPSAIELKAPRTTFSVSVQDGKTETVIERQGHGFQRTLLISALQLLAQTAASSDEGVICLAIEEPELFQHPTQALAFSKVLRALAEDNERHIQVTYATHSPYFVEPSNFQQIRRLVRTTSEKPEVSVHSTDMDAVKHKLADVVKADSVQSQLGGTISNQLSTALFSSGALLVEGSSDGAVIAGIADRSGTAALEARGIAVVAVSGKMNIPLAHAILDSIGIPTYSVFDADAGFESRARAKGKSDAAVANESTTHTKSNRALLKYFGLAEVDFPAESVGPSVAIFGDHLEASLNEYWPGWMTEFRKLESEVEMPIQKNADAYRTVTQRAEGDVPSVFTSILEKISLM
ncbi:ATP-dependent nuclease [Mycetocola saprophilus]|uniref:ATP-dependent nuclease n=1 Tax=Mycetocola saprophilus TaxID=76636 RepID=UPI0009DD372A|nr:ATP-dependent endonuclease [Mycetocola saprophilus]